MSTHVDVNGDVGESFGTYRLGHDEALMPHLTSANIACGFHAGDPGVMRATVVLARHHGVCVGAHPGFSDLVGFGRRNMAASAREIEDLVAYQIGALAGIAAGEGVRLRHVKPHGALYNMAATDPEVADAIARGVAGVDRSLALVGLSGSALVAAALRLGLRGVSEVFADRAYQPDGKLVPRTHPNAVVHEPRLVVERAVRMVSRQSVTALDGSIVAIQAETLCVHGDTPGAADLARLVREGLAQAGVIVQAVGAA